MLWNRNWVISQKHQLEPEGGSLHTCPLSVPPPSRQTPDPQLGAVRGHRLALWNPETSQWARKMEQRSILAFRFVILVAALTSARPGHSSTSTGLKHEQQQQQFDEPSSLFSFSFIWSVCKTSLSVWVIFIKFEGVVQQQLCVRLHSISVTKLYQTRLKKYSDAWINVIWFKAAHVEMNPFSIHSCRVLLPFWAWSCPQRE